MSESKGFFDRYFRVFLLICIGVAIVMFAVMHIGVVGNVLMVLLGFGLVIMVHEFGHFVVAKASGIKVEAFSLFMPPILLGVQRREEGIRIRILPEILTKPGKNEGDPQEAMLTFTVGGKGNPSDTEYRIGLIPFGGFVKMLGQDDVGSVKSSKDPRSFANKPALSRAAVLAAGVTFNVLSAVIIFMIAFLKGINLPPAVVGGVIPNSPAAQAGLQPGDEVIEIAGKKKDLDFTNIAMAAALSGRDQHIEMKVRHEDGSQGDYTLVAEQTPNQPIRTFGIVAPDTLTIAALTPKDAYVFYKSTGLRPGDRILAVNGQKVQTNWELMDIIENTLAPDVVLTAERKDKQKGTVSVESRIKLRLIASENGNIFSMVPRFQMENLGVIRSSDSKISRKVHGWLERLGLAEPVKQKPFLRSGDIILGVGDVTCPTYQEFRATVGKSGGKELPIDVLREVANGVDSKHTILV
ncbi:MAG: site-2 protease family protein, partial [Sedimentisphaerales bacterium]